MNSTPGSEAPRRLVERLLERERLSPHEARQLLESAEARCEIAARDPAALFDLLGSLPPRSPAPPAPRLGADELAGRARRVLRGLGAAAAAALAVAALTLAVRAPAPAPVGSDVRLAGTPGDVGFRSGDAVSRVVRRLDSRTAQVVTVVPDSPEDPTVTLILDEEIDL